MELHTSRVRLREFVEEDCETAHVYGSDPEAIRLEYMNWKQAVSPYARYIPVITAMGNHESLLMRFFDEMGTQTIQIDNFPFEKFSAEAIYSQ